MSVYHPDGTHEPYTRTNRHWCAKSETYYTGADSLLTAQRMGWQLTDIIYYEDVRFAGNRFTTVYHVVLRRNQERRVMPVLCNPFMQRLVEQPHIQLYPYRDLTEEIPLLEAS